MHRLPAIRQQCPFHISTRLSHFKGLAMDNSHNKMTPALKKDPRLGCSECPSRKLTRDPEPAHSTFTQFPVHVLINPSTAAGSREMLPRHPLINGERGLQQGT